MIFIKEFGLLENGNSVNEYTLKNSNNMEVTLINLGATITSIKFPDALGNLTDVVLGFDDLQNYEKNIPVFGSVVGRNANRIENASFELNGICYNLDKNDGQNNLHSGNSKIYTKLWEVKTIDTVKNEVLFSLLLEDGYQGFPGNFNVNVKYSLTEENELIIEYSGMCDKDTIANFTNHTYFNLNGHNNGDVLDHKLKIYSKEYTPFKENINIPSGEIKSVLNTPFDFTYFKAMGQDIMSDDIQLKIANGYDHNFVLDKEQNEYKLACEVFSEKTKIFMQVFTDAVGVQFYTANFLDTSLKGKENCYYDKRDGFCLETQYFPNAINTINFKSPILRKGEQYYTKTCYKFKLL